MKKSRICLFAFRPESYRQMEAYLNEMMASGWKLRWCRGLLAGFEAAGEETLRYVVDPEAMTSLAYFRRYPKSHLQVHMQEGWYGVAKSKGCQILATAEPEAPSPAPQQDISPLIKSTCRLASLIWILALLIVGWWLFSKAAVIYSVILTNIYLVLSLLGGFLLVYHIANAVVLTVSKRLPERPRFCKRYFVHSGMLLFILLTAVVLEMNGRNDMLFYLSIPIIVIFGGMVILNSMSGPKRNINQLSLVVSIISVLMFGMIIFLNGRMNQANADYNTRQQEILLEQADQLPVLHLSDFGYQDDPQQAVQTNSSILGDNLLYAEESDAGYLFTNYTTMRSPALAEPIFHYLYQQAQVDFQETFTIDPSLGTELHILKNAHSCLFQNGSTVCLFTVPEGTDLLYAAKLLLEKDTLALP